YSKNAGPLARRLYSIFVYSDNPFSLKEMLKFVNNIPYFGDAHKKGGPKTKKVVHGPPFLEKRWSKKSAQQCTKMAFLLQNRHFPMRWTTWTTFFTLFYI
ncbi:MAG: hypothetical protein VZQ81_09705, partial [Succiniclasticum sp.]|nr:hypothetical protein [Succiniclasticum sp.]